MRLLLPLLLLPGLAAAQSPDAAQCVPTGDEARVLSEAPVDLGDGLVAQHYLAGADDEIPDPFVVFTDCASGGLIVVALPELEDGTQRTAEQVITVMTEAVESEEAISAADMAQLFSAMGAPAQLRQSGRESCACASFYPDLVGEKTPWETGQ